MSVIGASNAVQLVAHGEQRRSIAALRAVVICCAAKNVGVVSQKTIYTSDGVKYTGYRLQRIPSNQLIRD